MEDPTPFIHDAMPLTRTLGVTAEKAERREVVLRLEWAEGLCTAGGVLHGGALMALADSAGATCAFLNLPEGATATSTIESKTNFMRAVRSGAVTARATLLHAGRTTIVVETTITDGDGRLVAKTLQTQAVIAGD